MFTTKDTLAVVMRNNGYGYFRLDSEADVGTVQSIESVKGTRKQATIKLHAEPLRALVVTGRLRDPHPSMPYNFDYSKTGIN